MLTPYSSIGGTPEVGNGIMLAPPLLFYARVPPGEMLGVST